MVSYIIVAMLRQDSMIHQAANYDASCVSTFTAGWIILCCLSLPKLRQHSVIHQAPNNDASCVLTFEGWVGHTLLPEFAQAQATPWDTPGPKL